MSTLHDLRATLDREAATVHDTATTTRVAAVRGRARALRRRRTAAGAVAAALVIGGASAVALLPGDGPPPAADRQLGDHVAPESLSSLGWEYDFEGGTHEETNHLVLKVPASDTPTLLSWATDEGGPVEVFDNGRSVYSSTAEGFTDFVVLPQGPQRRVFVDTEEPGVAAATYTLDSSITPPGVGEGPGAFRSEAAGRRLLGAAYGDRGETSVEVDVTLPQRGEVWVATVCEDLPRGVRMHVTRSGIDGDVVTGACSGSTVDPGGSPHVGFGVGPRGGAAVTYRIWLSRDGEPVPDGEAGDIRLGLGLYADGPQATLAGLRVPRTLESGGHTWVLEHTATGSSDEPPAADLPDGGPWLATVTLDGRGVMNFRLMDDGEEVDGGTAMGTSGSFSEIFLPGGPGRRVAVDPLGRTSGGLGLAVYRVSD